MDRAYIEINTAAGSKQLILGREPVSIGRHAENKLVLADNMASRFHCVIEKAPDGYILRDLGASNGTLVNGRKVKSALLQPGDVVRVGNTDLVLVLPESEANPPSLDQKEELVELGDEDMVDALTEDDVVEDLIPLSQAGLGGDGSALSAALDPGDYEHSLRRMAEASFSRPFGETDISLVNPRGQ